MDSIPLSKVFHLIEPGPVVLVTTADRGHANIMTMTWHTMMEFEPPLIGCVISSANHSFKALLKTKECVIAIPTAELLSKVVKIGNCSGKEVDKFDEFRLTPLPAGEVKAPLIGECFANLECRAIDTSLVRKYGLFILEVVRGWTDPKHKERRTIHHNGDGTFVVDGETKNLKKKMVKWQDMV